MRTQTHTRHGQFGFAVSSVQTRQDVATIHRRVWIIHTSLMHNLVQYQGRRMHSHRKWKEHPYLAEIDKHIYVHTFNLFKTSSFLFVSVYWNKNQAQNTKTYGLNRHIDNKCTILIEMCPQKWLNKPLNNIWVFEKGFSFNLRTNSAYLIVRSQCASNWIDPSNVCVGVLSSSSSRFPRCITYVCECVWQHVCVCCGSVFAFNYRSLFDVRQLQK